MKYTHATIIVNLCFFGLRNGFANGCYNMPCICFLRCLFLFVFDRFLLILEKNIVLCLPDYSAFSKYFFFEFLVLKHLYLFRSVLQYSECSVC